MQKKERCFTNAVVAIRFLNAGGRDFTGAMSVNEVKKDTIVPRIFPTSEKISQMCFVQIASQSADIQKIPKTKGVIDMYLLTKRKITDRCWIPLCLTKERRAKKWLGFIVLVALLFLVFWLVLIFCGTARGEDFFFKKWEVKKVVQTPYGFQATLVNPNPEGIRSVNVAISPDDSILGYWFFDEEGNPQVWKIGEKGYKRNREEERGCIRCHEIKPQVRL